MSSRVAVWVSFILAILVVLAPGNSRAAEEEHSFEVGVWLNRMIMQKGEAEIASYIEQAAASGVTSIFPNYWFHGYVIYPGSQYVKQHPDFVGWDPMQVVISESKKHNLKVYPWFEYGFFTHFTRDSAKVEGAPEDIGYILAGHEDWMTINKTGRKGLHNSSMGVTHYSLNPGNAAAREFLANVALEVMQKYPEVDGIHLDRIRYQGAEWSFDDASRRQFAEVAGIDPTAIPEGDPELQSRWKRWREDQVNKFMQELATTFRAEYPTKQITAAVVPPYMKEEKFQRWEEWVQHKNLDITVPMVYGDAALVRREMERTMAMLPEGSSVWAGIDAGVSAEQLAASIRTARELGAQGVVIWNDEAFLAKNMNVQNVLAPQSQPASRPASQPTASQPVREQPDLY